MITIAIPVYRVSCRVGIERGRPWSVVDELVLWAVARSPATAGELAAASSLPQQLLVASLARLMRFRLVEVSLGAGRAAFRVSEVGAKLLTSGEALPFFGKRYPRRVSFVIERVTGQVFASRSVQFQPNKRVEDMRARGIDVRIAVVDGDPPMSHHANFARLAEVALRGPDEQLISIDDKTASTSSGFIIVKIAAGYEEGIPRGAGDALRQAIREIAGAPGGEADVAMSYVGSVEPPLVEPTYVECTIDPSDVVVGGSIHRETFERLIASSYRRVVIHSTFLQGPRFEELFEDIRAACRRGVQVDVLWGAALDDANTSKNAGAALEIMRRVREDADTQSRVRVRLASTGSHAKIILVDTPDGDWVAAVGSCNWLSSPFGAVELSVVLREPRAVAQVVDAVQRLVGRRGLCDELATEMAIAGDDLRRRPLRGGAARVAVVVGEAHDALMRKASGSACRRLVIGSNRLGATARTGAIIPGEVAAARSGVRVALLYRQPSGPVKRPDARALAQEAAGNDVRVIETNRIPLHGKFLAWDDDDVLVTSLNWASAAVNPDFPYGEIGVHVSAPGMAADLLARLTAIYPDLAEPPLAKKGPL